MQQVCSSRFGFWGSYRPLEGPSFQGADPTLRALYAITWGGEDVGTTTSTTRTPAISSISTCQKSSCSQVPSV